MKNPDRFIKSSFTLSTLWVAKYFVSLYQASLSWKDGGWCAEYWYQKSLSAFTRQIMGKGYMTIRWYLPTTYEFLRAGENAPRYGE